MENSTEIKLKTKNKFLIGNSNFKLFEINWEKIQTLEDMKNVIKCLNISMWVDLDKIPVHLKEAIDNKILIEKI